MAFSWTWMWWILVQKSGPTVSFCVNVNERQNNRRGRLLIGQSSEYLIREFGQSRGRRVRWRNQLLQTTGKLLQIPEALRRKGGRFWKLLHHSSVTCKVFLIYLLAIRKIYIYIISFRLMWWAFLRYLEGVHRPHPNWGHQTSIYVSMSGMVM
jgi:hypothetical protein